MSNRERILNDDTVQAAKVTASQIGLVAVFLVFSILVLAVISGFVQGAIWAKENMTIYQLVAVGIPLVLMALYLRNYYIIREKGVNPKTGWSYNAWMENTGEKPPFKKVSAKLNTGEVRWAVD